MTDRQGPKRKTVYLCDGCVWFHRKRGIRDGDYCRRLGACIQNGQATLSCPHLNKKEEG